MTENRMITEATQAVMTTLPQRRPLPTMTAEPSQAPPSINELEQACVSAYAEFVAARRRVTQAEIAQDSEQACISAYTDFDAARRRLTAAEIAHATAIKGRRS